VDGGESKEDFLMSVMAIVVNFDEYHCTECGRKAFDVLSDKYACRGCGNFMSADDLRAGNPLPEGS